MEDEKSQNIASQLTMIEVNITHIRNDMKQLTLAQKMAKATKMSKLQQQITMLRTQQKHHEEKVEELQDELERVTCIIQFVHQRVHDLVPTVGKVMPKHVSFDLMGQL